MQTWIWSFIARRYAYWVKIEMTSALKGSCGLNSSLSRATSSTPRARCRGWAREKIG